MPINFDFLGHLSKFNRQIDTLGEFKQRLANFTFVHNWIEEHNSTNATWTAGHNQFSDWSAAEYKNMLGYSGRRGERKESTIFAETNASSVNWTDAGAVTPVKDQGACGSCWAFSTTGSLEGAHYIATGELLSFSEQQLVDCAGYQEGFGNYGCQGGLQEEAYKYYESGKKAELESTYPYFSGSTQRKGSCQYDAGSATAVTVSDYLAVLPKSPTQMKAALEKQPLAVSIEADKMVFQTYKTGVLNSTKCGTQLDHAVLAVGYGTENGQDYWLVKNSWNTTWGDQGYIKLAIVEGDGICGVQMGPSHASSN
eukprot:Macronucleus_905.p1 GENE.Macronucleus_905~~Macronucleus_905.p1  ORF type:complete len:311 (+),score=179.78 Macronucleus_905:1-933(+)